MFKKSLFATLALVAMCSVSTAQERRADDPQEPITPNRFVLKVSGAGIAEVAFAKMAAQKANSEDVRKFAQMLMDDHTKANKKLAQIAETKQIPIAREMEPKHQEKERKFSELTGAAFDREYVTSMVKSHEDSISLFTKFSETATDADLKAFANETLPTLKEHLKMAKELADKIR
jgi:putative membrane protein